jgi:hypothetical protein
MSELIIRPLPIGYIIRQAFRPDFHYDEQVSQMVANTRPSPTAGELVGIISTIQSCREYVLFPTSEGERAITINEWFHSIDTSAHPLPLLEQDFFAGCTRALQLISRLLQISAKDPDSLDRLDGELDCYQMTFAQYCVAVLRYEINWCRHTKSQN